jgi:hypothetical protein
MENKEDKQDSDEQFDPHIAFNRLLELFNQLENLDNTNKKEADKQRKEITKEANRLSKLTKEYYKKKSAEFKIQKDIK